MKVRNPAGPGKLPAGLCRLLEEQRRRRGFDTREWTRAKLELLDAYCEEHGIDAAVVGVSGGVDSALVAALACRSKRLVELKLVFLPVWHESASGQDAAEQRVRDLTRALGREIEIIDLTDAHRGLAEAALGLGGLDRCDPWAAGQLVSYLRTPALYFQTSLLAARGLRAVVLGTINRDEGAYLGYVGKAGDGMVDIQLIADLHKSEVYAAARELGVPESILKATPTGDMFDGRTDEQVFGAPYDFVELYLGWLCLSPAEQRRALATLDDEERALFEELAASLERVHAYNAHKYLVGSPAVHLNVLQSAVPGGWR